MQLILINISLRAQLHPNDPSSLNLDWQDLEYTEPMWHTAHNLKNMHKVYLQEFEINQLDHEFLYVLGQFACPKYQGIGI